MSKKPNNGPSFTKKLQDRVKVKYDAKGYRRSFVKGSKSAKTGNLKRWSRW